MNGNNIPLVSIIVNCYNSDLYLKETLDSVLAQTYRNWEIIFWDNQSTDNSAKYFKEYKDSRFKYFYASEHTPLSKARNLASEKATGSFLGFLDCDDLWFPNKLYLQVKCLQQEDIGFVYSKFIPLLCSDEQTAKNHANHYNKLKLLCNPHAKRNLYTTLLSSNYIIFSSVLIKRSAFISVGGLKNDLIQNEDYDLLLRLSLISLGECVDYVGVQYRIHAVNNSHINAERNFIENEIIFSTLPPSKEIINAKQRNQIKYGLFKIFMQQDYSGIKMLKYFYAPKYLIKILIDRVVYNFRKYAKI